jgi:hypothetical protein
MTPQKLPRKHLRWIADVDRVLVGGGAVFVFGVHGSSPRRMALSVSRMDLFSVTSALSVSFMAPCNQILCCCSVVSCDSGSVHVSCHSTTCSTQQYYTGTCSTPDGTTCRDKQKDGTTCSSSNVCLSDLCYQGVCQTAQESGTPCTVSDTCSSVLGTNTLYGQ